MEIEVKLTSVHVIVAIITGYISFYISSGLISGVGKNEYLAILIGLVILYITGQASERAFGKEKVGGLKGWFLSGIIPFFFVWVLTWTLLMNYYLI
ncbi:MAG: hypothetical protein ACLQG5_07210 [Methanobacterium sp.]|jgi:hypothetical protein